MLDELVYNKLLTALRGPLESVNRRSWEPYHQAVEVDLVLDRGVELSVKMHLTPLALIEMWHEHQSVLNGFSVLVAYASVEQRACVSRCADGTVQSEQCSDTARDMKNCLEVTTLRCRSRGSISGPGTVGQGRGQMDTLVRALRSQYERR